MSGIVGCCDFNRNIDKKILRHMINVIKHRGKDSLNIFIDDNVGLAYCLLSFNREKIKRPVHNESSSVYTMLDGLIYNYPELRRKLEKLGHKFYSNAEDEVIVHLYEEYGPNCAKMIDGDFAFALWDANKKELILARDGIGSKPLFYTLVDKKLLFASEIKSLLAFGIKREVDLEALYKYINYIELPGTYTLFKGIKKLPPGFLIIYNKHNFKTFKYWDIEFHPKVNLPEKVIIKKLTTLLEESFSKRIKSNAIGVALSGGLDSSAILAFLKDVEENVDSYTLDCNRSMSEFKKAREIADFFNSNHHEFTIEPKHIYLLPKAVWFADHSRLLPTTILFHYLLSKTARNKRILFAGYGTDGLFGNSSFIWVKRTEFLRGIPYTIRSKASILAKFLPLKLRPFIFSGNKKIFTHTSRFFLTPYEKNSIFRYKCENENLYRLNSTNTLEVYNRSILRDLELSLIQNLKIICNAHSQEAVFPFLDTKIVNFVCKIPFKIRLKGDKSKKYLLKKCVERKLPRKILKRKKIIPVHEYLEKEWFDEHKEILQHFISKLLERKYFKRDGILKFLKNNKHNYENLWMLIGFELWHEIFIDREKIKAPKSLKEFL
jgi:asparagine synthase (glutamine-hydrolysing)